MKKLILLSLLSVSVSCFGEDLAFVTTMSAPVGSFAQVETSNTATAQNVTLHNVGAIQVNNEAQLGNVKLNQGTLKSNAGHFIRQKSYGLLTRVH